METESFIAQFDVNIFVDKCLEMQHTTMTIVKHDHNSTKDCLTFAPHPALTCQSYFKPSQIRVESHDLESGNITLILDDQNYAGGLSIAVFFRQSLSELVKLSMQAIGVAVDEKVAEDHKDKADDDQGLFSLETENGILEFFVDDEEDNIKTADERASRFDGNVLSLELDELDAFIKENAENNSDSDHELVDNDDQSLFALEPENQSLEVCADDEEELNNLNRPQSQVNDVSQKRHRSNKLILVDREGVIPPVKGHATDAGIDIFIQEDYLLQPGQTMYMPAGCKFDLHPDYHVEVVTRSSTSDRYPGLVVTPTIVDCEYAGEISTIATNTNSDRAIKIEKGSRIAQLLLKRHYYFDDADITILDQNSRGEGRFGSTGSN